MSTYLYCEILPTTSSVWQLEGEKTNGLGVYQIMLAKLVSWKEDCSIEIVYLKWPEIINMVEVGNANSQHR